MAKIWISVPTDQSDEFERNWRELRLAEALDPEFDLTDPATIENFDSATIVQWAVDLKEVGLGLVSAALTYLIAARGEFEYEKDGEKFRFKNLKPSKVREILDLIDERPEQ